MSTSASSTPVPLLQNSLSIRSSSSAYRVEFPAVSSLAHWQPQADLLLVDDFFAGRLDPALDDRVILIHADEAAKSFERISDVLLELKRRGLTRSSTVLGLGGGVIQDITTFVASVYMRGIDWIYVPSTFLAMADSCLGGKSSINVGPAKNLVGTFHPPQSISVMAPLARSLPVSELRGGLAEAAKICFCHGPESFERYLVLAAPLLSGEWDDQQLADLLHHVLSVKKWFIETDEFDRAERRLLNFGHTWGHALESATGYRIPHGPAVALGMQAAHHFAGAPPTSMPLMAHSRNLLDGVDCLEGIHHFDADRFLEAFRSDKKHGRTTFHVIIPSSTDESAALGVVEQQLERGSAQENAVLEAMMAVIQELSA